MEKRKPKKSRGNWTQKRTKKKTPPAPPSHYTDPEKEFLKLFENLAHAHNSWEVFKDFVVLAACSISNGIDKAHFDEREKLYLTTIRKYSPKEQKMFPQLLAHTVMALEKNPRQDFLGKAFMTLNLGSNEKGQIFTPYHVCEMMAEITMNDISQTVAKDGYFTINDPCCGAGATLIAGINKARDELAKEKLNFQNHILVTGQDIDMTVLLMCYIQVSLLGVAGYFKVGNSLTDPMTGTDSTENYWFTPMYFSDVWRWRRVFHHVNDLMKGDI